jgi:hypothetical protein
MIRRAYSAGGCRLLAHRCHAEPSNERLTSRVKRTNRGYRESDAFDPTWEVTPPDEWAPSREIECRKASRVNIVRVERKD